MVPSAESPAHVLLEEWVSVRWRRTGKRTRGWPAAGVVVHVGTKYAKVAIPNPFVMRCGWPGPPVLVKERVAH